MYYIFYFLLSLNLFNQASSLAPVFFHSRYILIFFLTALATHYSERQQHYLASPLYLQAISLISKSNCHTVVLMNNLATSLLLQRTPSTPYDPPSDPNALLSNARQWAQKALDTADAIPLSDKNKECDEGCAAAMYNLGEFASLEGDVREARRWWEEGRNRAKGVGFVEGARRCEEGLRGLNSERT